jgi:hypothetical protein
METYIASSTTPMVTPTLVLTKYQVQSGDTLGEISIKFGVPVADIMQINGLEDADALGVGMELLIPVTPTETTIAPSATQAILGEITTTPLPFGNEKRIVIANVFGAGDLATERVRLRRKGDGDLSLVGWQLRDEDGHVYTFPQLTLYPGGTVDLYSGDGVSNGFALYWGLEQPVYESGEKLTLVDAGGNVQDSFQVP